MSAPHPVGLTGDDDAPPCVSCGLPGRWRPAPPGGESLPVCDAEWQLADGPTATNDTVVLRDPDPTTWARESAIAWEDEHESGVVVADMLRRGVRWHLLRWIDPGSRWLWWKQLNTRPPAPAGTRAAVEGGQVWLDHAAEVIAAQGWQARRQRTWMLYAEGVASAVPVDGGAVTRDGCTVPELAEHVGCSEDYISDITASFVELGLLHVLVPGTRRKAMPAPSDETPEEAAEREAREAAAAQARAARAEAVHGNVIDLDVWRDAPPPAVEVEHGCPYLRTDPSTGERWVHVAQVYELRLPAPAEAPELPAEAWAAPKVTRLGKARQRRAQARYGTLHGRHVQPGRLAALPGQTKKSDPNEPPQERDRPSSSSGGVEERAASPRSHEGQAVPGQGPNQPTRPPSRVVRAAQRLLGRLQKPGETPVDEARRTLPPQLRDVTVAWLARRIARHVLAGWTDYELVLAIAHDGGRHGSCSPTVRNPEAFINAALRRWPANSPYRDVDAVEDAEAVRQAVDAVENLNADLARSRDTRARRIRQAIDECPRCDGDGFAVRPARHATGVVVERCDHREPDPLTELPAEAKQRFADDTIADTLERARRHREQRLAADGKRAAHRKTTPTPPRRHRRREGGAWDGHDFDPRDQWR
jgi:hypothetical protein